MHSIDTSLGQSPITRDSLTHTPMSFHNQDYATGIGFSHLNRESLRVDMYQIVLQIIAVVLIIIGVVTFPLPIPVGIVLIGIGLSLLIISNKRVRNTIRRYRKRYPNFDALMVKAEQYTPAVISRIIQRTAPVESQVND